MGRSGSPARRAAEADPVVRQTAKVMNDATRLFGTLAHTDLPHDLKVHAYSAVLALMAVHAYQTGQKPPWERLKEIR